VNVFQSFLLIIFLFTGYCCVAQQTFWIKGKITSDENEALPAVNVFDRESATGTYSDSAGNFQLQSEKGKHHLLFSYVGFETKEIDFILRKDTMLKVVLKKSILLNAVTIIEKKKEASLKQEATGTFILRAENIAALPSVLGEQDLVKAVQMLPGVQSGNEGIGGIFVRGGSPDQNLILLDGATVFNPSHLYGFISVFNSDMVGMLTMHKNDMPARYGSRLASVLEIETQSGDTSSRKGSVAIGLVTSKANINGPFRNKNTTYNFSARGSYMGAISSPISAMQFRKEGYEGNIRYFFFDVNGRIDHRFNRKTSLSLSYFTNYDFYQIRTGDSFNSIVYNKKSSSTKGLSWINMASSATLKHQINSNAHFIQQVTYSRYWLKTSSAWESREARDNITYFEESFKQNHVAAVNNISFKSEITKSFGNIHQLTGGVEYFARIFQIGKTDRVRYRMGKDSIENKSSAPLITGHDMSGYAEYQLNPVHWLTLHTGFRLTAYAYQDFFKMYPQYRASIYFKPLKYLNFRLSANSSVQTVHLLSSTSADMPVDYWVPATGKVDPETSRQFSGGMFGNFAKRFQWSIDGFYRKMEHLADFKGGSDFKRAGARWETSLFGNGTGEAYGAEFFLSKSGNKISAQASYTLQWSNRRFKEINYGEAFPYRYDRRHNIALALNYRLNKKWDFSMSWVYGSGNMFTMPTQYYHSYWGVLIADLYATIDGVAPEQGEVITVYNKRNSFRLPAYHHLDVAANYRWKKRKHEQSLNISIYNVYSRFNVFAVYADYRYDSNGNGKLFLKQLSLFPILPSITYSVYFNR
jgi:hypothetical protein